MAREAKFWMRVWDLPTRLFHWLVVLLIGALYATHWVRRMDLHILCGYAMLCLLLFRLIWGFVGSETSQFRQFIRSPLLGLRHLARFGQREPDLEIGHNAAGGWMVLAMLALLWAQVIFGLGAHTRSGIAGPLAARLSPLWSGRFSQWHAFTWTLIWIAIVLHLLAILAYALVKRQDLVRPMVTGRKRLPGRLRAPRMVGNGMALAVFCLCAVMVWVLVTRLGAAVYLPASPPR